MANKNKKRVKRGPAANRFVLNCIKSQDMDDDWIFGDAVGAEFLVSEGDPPNSVDLRQDWWTIRDQKTSGACVGFATADGVLRWHYVTQELIEKDELISPRFIWMANKETDNFTSYPTSFLDSAGTSTKLALKVAKKYGCVLESMLPMEGRLSRMGPRAFFSIASQYRINAYYNLMNEDGCHMKRIKFWLANHGPVLTRLDVDEAFKYAQKTEGHLENYDTSEASRNGGHAVCLVGYTPDYLIVRNSWGDNWGDNGFAYAHNSYAREAFTEAYGAVLNHKNLVIPNNA